MATASETGQDNGSFGKSSDFLAGDNSPKSTLSSKHKADKKGHRPRSRQEDGLPYFGHSVTRINPLQLLTFGASWQQVGSQRSTSSQESQISDDSQRSDYAAVGPVGMNKKKGNALQSYTSNTTNSENATEVGSSFRDTRPEVTNQFHHHGQETDTIRTEDMRSRSSAVYDTLDPSLWFYDSQKKKGTLKKRCKWVLLILICMGVSVLIALASLNNKETKQFTSIKNDMPKKSAFKQQKQDLTFMRQVLEMLKAKYLETTGGCGNTCVNVTSGVCVDNCSNITDGHYQSCSTCHGYVSCVNQQIIQRNCSSKNLLWDDSIKTCDWSSKTCNKTE